MSGRFTQLPLVTLFGRTNVGKSTIFNRLTEKSQALVSDISGTTRDSNLGVVAWDNYEFELADTAGFYDFDHLEKRPKKKVEKLSANDLAQRQAARLLSEAQLILFIVDNRDGLTTDDRRLAKALKSRPELIAKTMVVVNKVDSFKYASEAAVFTKLGLGTPQLISASSGSGTGDLLSKILTRLSWTDNLTTLENRPEEIRVTFIGKPNVGKSSLVNALLGYDRSLVSDEPHTTREPQDAFLTWRGKNIRLVDTAGLTKEGHKRAGLEKASGERALTALHKSDLILFVLDVSEPLTKQDARLVGEIIAQQKSLILLANKWDKIKPKDVKGWTQKIYNHFPFVAWAPIKFVSAKSGLKVPELLDLILEIAAARELKVSDSQLQKLLAKIVKIHLPAKGKGLKAPRIYEFTQTQTNPPTFKIRIGSKDNLHFSYVRFMENRLREKYNFIGTPLKMEVVNNKRVHSLNS
ncbi:MAG: ribosome biogenesis GTPase Der [Patescibacteria group bacterium]|jgi:GTP-binding protein